MPLVEQKLLSFPVTLISSPFTDSDYTFGIFKLFVMPILDAQYLSRSNFYSYMEYIQINIWNTYRWAFPYWPGYHPSTHIGPRLRLGPIWGSLDDNQANMEMPMYSTIYYILPTSRKETPIFA